MNKYGVLGKETISRVEKAITETKKNKCELLITSGWAYRNDTSLEIGKVVFDYIIKNFNLQNCTILYDTNSRDTVGDAFYLRKRLRKYKITKLYVVTSDYHTNRTEIIFNEFFPPEINIVVIGTVTKFKNCSITLKKEESSLNSFKNTFKNANFKNDKNLLSLLGRLHPYYNGEIHPAILN